MKVVINQKSLSRRKKIGQWTTIASLIVLAGGFILTLNYDKDKTDYVSYSFVALIVGFLLSQVGIYYTSRWGRSPRPDEVITQALKGLGEKYSLYHYTTPVSHLLIGPAGIWVLVPYLVGGKITYDSKKQRWIQKGGNAYLKIFAQESLGRPDLDVPPLLAKISKFFEREFPGIQFPNPQAALVFVHPKIDVQAPDSPIPTLSADKLKEFIRRTAKQDSTSMEAITQLQEKLPDQF